MKRIALAVVAVLCLSLASLSGAARDSVQPLQWLSTGEDPQLYTHCTTTSVDEKQGLWLTAAHCIMQPHDFVIGGSDAELVAWNTTVDLALLKSSPAPAIKLGDAPNQDDEIVFRGYPLGMPFVAQFRGRVAAQREWFIGPDGYPIQRMLLDVTGAPGVSGSAVLDKHRHLISVLQIGFQGYGRMMGGATYDQLVSFIHDNS